MRACVIIIYNYIYHYVCILCMDMYIVCMLNKSANKCKPKQAALVVVTLMQHQFRPRNLGYWY